MVTLLAFIDGMWSSRSNASGKAFRLRARGARSSDSRSDTISSYNASMLHVESLRRLVRPRRNNHNVACFHDDPQSEIEYYDIQEELLSLSLHVQVSNQLTYQPT
jgi:hypothetical protein